MEQTKTNLKELVSKLRQRLLQYRLSPENQEVSIHINALEIALSLVELGLSMSPSRPISSEEENWFKAGYFLSYDLDSSEWRDLSDMYSMMVDEVKRMNYFRS